MTINNNSSVPPVTVFVDRDGTINVNLPFPNVNAPEKLVLIEGAAQAIGLLKDAGCRILVVTNQAGISNPENELSQEMFDSITTRLNSILETTTGVTIDDQFVCPHQAEDNCTCRKPAIGLFLEAQMKYPDIVFAETFVVGDRTDDMLAAHEIGAQAILVLTGHGMDTLRALDNSDLKPAYIASDLLEAAQIIENLLLSKSELNSKPTNS